MVFEAWKRNKRRLLAAVAAGAVGAAAAYCAYSHWWAASGEGEDGSSSSDDGEGPSGSGSGGAGPPQGVLLEPTGSAATARLDAASHLQHHFESIQEIADGTTIPSLLPALARALAQAADVESRLERLRQAREGGAAALGPEAKLALWREMAAAAFARAAAAAWLLPLLDLFVRVQLNILGRHLYLETALGGTAGGAAGTAGAGGGLRLGGLAAAAAPAMPRLSAASQERFLSLGEHLAGEGAEALVAAALEAAEAALGGADLAQPLDAEGVGALLSAILTALESGGGGGAPGGSAGWAACLLPDPAALRASLALRAADNRAVLGGSEAALVDPGAVEGMAGEAARIVQSARFHEAATECAKEVARQLLADVAGRMGGEALPLARVVPLVAAAAAAALDPGTPAIAVLAALAPVVALSSTVYACGPPL